MVAEVTPTLRIESPERTIVPRKERPQLVVGVVVVHLETGLDRHFPSSPSMSCVLTPVSPLPSSSDDRSRISPGVSWSIDERFRASTPTNRSSTATTGTTPFVLRSLSHLCHDVYILAVGHAVRWGRRE